jgi:hypothetical protein
VEAIANLAKTIEKSSLWTLVALKGVHQIGNRLGKNDYVTCFPMSAGLCLPFG